MGLQDKIGIYVSVYRVGAKEGLISERKLFIYIHLKQTDSCIYKFRKKVGHSVGNNAKFYI